MHISLDINLRLEVADLLNQASKSIVLPYFKNLTEKQIKSKSEPSDLVTLADEMTETFLSEKLKQLVPGSQVIGEEAADKQPVIMRQLGEPGIVWLIDPIDGTGNYVKGDPNFAIAVALLDSSQTIMGWIHKPLEESTIWAGKDEGSWCGKVKLEIIKKFNNTGYNDIKGANYHQNFITAPNMPYSSVNRTGSAACEYWNLITNQIQYTTFSRLKPWDHAAGVLIHQEAGGYSAFLSQTPYSASIYNETGLLSTPTETIWNTIASSAKST